MSAVKNLSLGNVVKIALPIVAVIIIGVLLLAACSRLGIGTSSSQGIPTPAAPAVVNNAAPPAAPENKDAAALAAAQAPAPAPTTAPAANPQPAAVIPTVQPAIVNEQGEVVISAGGQQPAAKDAQQQGISPAPSVAEAPSDLACGQRITHIVERGETVFSIARRYRTTTYSVARINRIANARTLAVGRRLVVVTCDRGGASAGGRRYVVRAGDNLYRIGLRFGTSAERIRIANGLPTYTISVGQSLVIP